MEAPVLVVLGQGYVGLPMALEATKAGWRVWGLDTSREIVDRINSGRSHIDDVPDEEIASALERGYSATDDPRLIEKANVVVVCVPTPLSESGGPDLKYVEGAARTIGKHVTSGSLVILESTTYPGTTEEVFAPLVTRNEVVVGSDIYIAFSPERVDPGNAIYGIKNTPKIVGGITENCTERAVAFYSGFVETVVPAKRAREAEMAKLIENTFRHVNIAMVNEMVRFCDELDIDLWDAIDCASTKPFGFMPFRPGPGVGGHCIPVDPSYLSHRVKAKLGYAFRMVELAEEINSAAPGYVADRLWQLLNDRRIAVNGAKILIVGVTYKADIADERESPAVPLARRLTSWGAHLSYYDPYVPVWSPVRETAYRELASVTSLDAAARAADVVVLLQAHSSIDLEQLATCGTPLLDTRGVLRGREGVTTL